MGTDLVKAIHITAYVEFMYSVCMCGFPFFGYLPHYKTKSDYVKTGKLI